MRLGGRGLEVGVADLDRDKRGVLAKAGAMSEVPIGDAQPSPASLASSCACSPRLRLFKPASPAIWRLTDCNVPYIFAG